MYENVLITTIAQFGEIQMTRNCLTLILLVVSGWKLFEKAGVPCWKSVIPFCSQYHYFKMIWNTKMFFVNLMLDVALDVTALGVKEPLKEFNFYALWLLFLVIASIAMHILYLSNLAVCFGKGKGFTVGLFLMPGIFHCILAFGSAQYKRKGSVQ